MAREQALAPPRLLAFNGLTDAQSPGQPGPERRTKSRIKLIAAVALAAAAIFDWTRPPREQLSVRAYDLAVIGTYRTAVRPITKHLVRCRFDPTCSRYSQEAMHERGFPQGLVLTTWRLVRCGPWIRPGTRDPISR